MYKLASISQLSTVAFVTLPAFVATTAAAVPLPVALIVELLTVTLVISPAFVATTAAAIALPVAVILKLSITKFLITAASPVCANKAVLSAELAV